MRSGLPVIRQIARVVWKDLLVEWRAPVRLVAVAVFAVALVILVAFAGSADASLLRKQAAGTLWIGILLASTRSLDRSFQTETEQGALEGLVLWPVDGIALYYGKAISNTLLLLLVASLLAPLVVVMFDAPVNGSLLEFAAFIVLGCAAVAAPGTLYAALVAQIRGASVMLPVLLLPLVIPAMLAAARGCSFVMDGDPMGQATAWLAVVAVFDLVQWSVAGVLFARLVEDT